MCRSGVGHRWRRSPAARTRDPDEAYRRSTVLVRNSPFVDPVAVQRITGKNLAVAIAATVLQPVRMGEALLLPDRYDDSGRISRAQELSGPRLPAEQYSNSNGTGCN